MAEIIQRELFENGEVVGYEYGGRLVRCKDCKYYNEYPSGFGCCEIHKGSIAIQTPFTFCAWGETKEDAEKTD